MINFSNKKTQVGRITNQDVLVTYSVVSCRGGNRQKSLRFSFSEKAVRMMCGNGLYANIGFDENYPDRIYFCSSDQRNGYKLTSVSDSKRYQCCFGSNNKYKDITNFVGEYSLEYDALQSAFYIDKNNKQEDK